jgi:hypothetical protein
MGMLRRPERMHEHGSYLAFDMQNPATFHLLYSCILPNHPLKTASCLFCEWLPVRSMEVYRDLRVYGQARQVEPKPPIQQCVKVSVVIVSQAVVAGTITAVCVPFLHEAVV